MAFTLQKYTPEEGLKNKSVFPATPISEDAARKQIQDMLDQILQMHNNLLQVLNSETDGSSGADNIGATPFLDIAGETIQAQLEAIRQKQVELVNDQLSFTDIASQNCVTNSYLASQAVTNDKILPGTILSGSIGSKQVKTANIDDGAVGTNQMAVMSVTDQILNTESVTTLKIKDRNVTTEKLADKAVTGMKIADTAITGDKIANAAIPESKLDAALVLKLSADRTRKITISTAAPSGGIPGDIWLKLI